MVVIAGPVLVKIHLELQDDLLADPRDPNTIFGPRGDGKLLEAIGHPLGEERRRLGDMGVTAENKGLHLSLSLTPELVSA
jgi:hypothetical protein